MQKHSDSNYWSDPFDLLPPKNFGCFSVLAHLAKEQVLVSRGQNTIIRQCLWRDFDWVAVTRDVKYS